MAHFYGTIHGNRGEASRLGTKSSGFRAVAASWQGAVEVYLTYNTKTGQDVATVSLIPWGYGGGTNRRLFHGPVSGKEEKKEENNG